MPLTLYIMTTNNPIFEEFDWGEFEQSLDWFDFETIKWDTINVVGIVDELVTLFKLDRKSVV